MGVCVCVSKAAGHDTCVYAHMIHMYTLYVAAYKADCRAVLPLEQNASHEQHLMMSVNDRCGTTTENV